MSAQNRIKLRLYELRIRHNRMTQAELAQKAGLSKTTISNLESGHLRRIELDTIAKLCKALDCLPNELFELLESSDAELLERQKNALADVLGSLQYGKPLHPDTLDTDLADIIQAEIQGETA
jgi:putative transcriptional regulator